MPGVGGRRINTFEKWPSEYGHFKEALAGDEDERKADIVRHLP